MSRWKEKTGLKKFLLVLPHFVYCWHFGETFEREKWGTWIHMSQHMAWEGILTVEFAAN